MDLAELVSSQMPEEASELFELAAADPQLFFAEIISLYRSGRLTLPRNLLRAIDYDLHHTDA
jgi:hypothetical protein